MAIRLDSTAAQAQLRQWGEGLRPRVRGAVSKALGSQAVELKQVVRSQVATQMTVVKKSFLKGFTAKVLDKDPARLPALYVGSRIPWSGMHETGGQIAGRMLIPLHGRVGRKRFKQQVDALMRGGNAYFIKNAHGHIILMAENLREHDQVLSTFKRRHRKALKAAGGKPRLKRGADIPIAVLVPRVVLRKRLDVERLVAAHVPRLVRAIESRLAGPRLWDNGAGAIPN